MNQAERNAHWAKMVHDLIDPEAREKRKRETERKKRAEEEKSDVGL